MTAFIDDHRGAYGVDPIGKALPVARRPTTPTRPDALIPPAEAEPRYYKQIEALAMAA